MVSRSTFSSSSTNFGRHPVNMSSLDRWISGLGGGTLVAYGLSRRSPVGFLLTALGAGLVHHGVTGHCNVYQALGFNTAKKREAQEQIASDVHFDTSVNIDRQPAEIYQFWRQLENLPRFMKHLESVTKLDENRSHWVAKGPAGETEEWDAEIYNEKENELISWRSLPGADVVNAGTVRFEPAANGGTEVKITMNYNVTGGRVADMAARLFGQAPEQLIKEDLQRLKYLLESSDFEAGSFSKLEQVDDFPEEPGETKGASKAMGGTLMGRAHSNIS